MATLPIFRAAFGLFRTLVVLILSFWGNTVGAAEFVGSGACLDCHEQEYQAWQGSHHQMAMAHAKPDAVLGNFNDVEVSFAGKQNRFFRKQADYWVNIEGPDGKFHDYQVKYTFGYEPLQQYMVEFDDGRVQLIPFAWDSRPEAEGGQRWFHLYPQFTETHQEFYWTNAGQNWNYMCADCHSTNYKKGYDLVSNTYQSSWSEISVGCEACHGPASEHLAWTKRSAQGDKGESAPFAGFERALGKAVSHWVETPGKGTLAPESIADSQQTLVCAQCHSRHVQISDEDPAATGEFGDRYLLSLINASLYYADGQIYDEDYVYGSFLQSKMHRNGVVCSNCHDPHSGELVLSREALCLQCHQSDTYASTGHHHHPKDSAGSQCINCHMRETVYMTLDARADHRWHVPNSIVEQAVGSPDVCLDCHEDKDRQWSVAQFRQWYPAADEDDLKPFGPVFFAADQGYAGSATELSRIAQDINYAPIIRASAMERMASNATRNSLIAIARGARSEDSLLRLGAVRGAAGLPGAERWRLLAPLLNDSVLAVRSEAALVLAPLWPELDAAQQRQLQAGLKDYLAIQDFNADRGFAHTNRANIYAYQGDHQAAEAAYRESMRIEPAFANAYLNLSELYRRQQNEPAAIKILHQGMQANPGEGGLPHQLGLAYIRANQREKAVEYLRLATERSPENPRFHYVYGISLESSEPAGAQAALRKAYEISGQPRHLYALCDLQIKHKAFAASQCVAQLRQVAPPEVVAPLEARLRVPE